MNIPGQGVHNVLYVVTEHGSVYAFDADGNNPAQGYLWKVSFINPANGVTPLVPGDVGASDITPEMTITATPVIDPSTNTIYVVSHTKEVSGGVTNFVIRLHALDLTTGSETMNGPVAITASVPGTGQGSVNSVLNFDTRIHNPRAGLALVNGAVYIAFGSYGDQGPYHGWVLGYNAANVQQQVGSFTTTPNGGGGGIWMSGGGVSGDSAGNLYVGAGNGLFGTGNASGLDNYADSLIRLSTSNGITIADSFTPFNQQDLSFSDSDVGVSDVLLLPDQPGPYPHMLVSADKQGKLYVINRDGFGGFNPAVNNDIQTIATGTSLHNSISYFNNTIFVGSDGAPLEAFALQNGVMSGTPQSMSANIYGQNQATRSGTSPVISANGTSDGIVWALDITGGTAVLYAYDASNLGHMLYSSNQAPNQRDIAGVSVKFTTPSVVNGKVYVEGDGDITVYGLLSQADPEVTATPAFSPAPGKILNNPQPVSLSDATPNSTIYYTTDGSAASTGSQIYSAPLFISGPTTIHAFATTPGFTASTAASAFYTVLSNTVPVVPTFGAGLSNAGLTLNGAAYIAGTRLRLTDGGASQVSSGFYTTPVNVQRFTTQFLFQVTNPVGEGFTFTIQNANLGALGSTGGGLGYGPDPNFHISGSERSIGNSVAVKFDLADTSGEGINSTGLYINGAAPTNPAINLSGTGIDLHSSDTFLARLDYDGSTLTLTITDANTAATFSTNFAIDIPQTVGSATAYVGFTAASGTSTTSTQDILQWNYDALPKFSDGFSAAGMSLNGAASVVGTRLQLSDGGPNEAGSAFYATPLNIQQFATDFLFQLTNPEADGFTFVIQRAGASALGDVGGGLGYANGVGNSVGVKFDLFDNGGEGFNSTGLYRNGAVPTLPSIDLTSRGIDLHSGDVFHAELSYDGSNLSLTITDTNNPGLVFSTAFPIDIPGTVGGTTAFVGFTGGTGGQSAIQRILQWNFAPNASGFRAVPPVVASPVFNPPDGAVFNGLQSVALSGATPNSVIYYTTDGSTPSTSSAVYSSPIPISASARINAFASLSGNTASSVASAFYTVQAGPPSPMGAFPGSDNSSADVRIAGDFDGDGAADMAVWRPSNGTWYIVPSSNPTQPIVQQWGLPGDIPVPGDYDQDHKTDFAVWRPSSGTWYIIPSSNPAQPIVQQWGLSGDVPVVGDFNGDGVLDYGVWRPSNGSWYVISTASLNQYPSPLMFQQWGLPGDIPVPGDYDHDGRTDFAVWRPSNGTWYIIPSSNPTQPIVQQWGLQGDVPVVGDFNGDGNLDFAVWRPSNGSWYVLTSGAVSSYPNPSIFQQWGLPGDVPVLGDFDGDKRVDFAIWRPSNGGWYVIPSSRPTTPSVQQWGLPGDFAN